jgi:membrane protein YqaA with SNARE-associated domain
MDWRLVTEFFASVGYGLLSSFIPVFNSEVYIVAAQALGLTAEVSAAVGVALGQTIGKTAIVLGLRHGTRLPFLQHRIDRLRERTTAKPDQGPPGRIRSAYRRWSARLLALIGHSRWGSAIIFLSGATGLPPVFAVQFLVPATKMPAWLFAVALFLGRCVLFLAVAFGASAIIARLFS